MFKGVLFGVCVDVGGSYLVGTVMFIVYASTLSTADMSSDDLRAVGITYTSLITSFDNVWSWTGLLFGLSCSVLGGYVCAAHARGYASAWRRRVRACACAPPGCSIRTSKTAAAASQRTGARKVGGRLRSPASK